MRAHVGSPIGPPRARSKTARRAALAAPSKLSAVLLRSRHEHLEHIVTFPATRGKQELRGPSVIQVATFAADGTPVALPFNLVVAC
jgi:hypothetical protein